MKRAVWHLLAGLLFTSLSHAAYATDDDYVSFKPEDARMLEKLVSADTRFHGYLSKCAADQFGVEQSYFDGFGMTSDISGTQCVSDARACFNRCTEGESEACLRMARGLEEAKPEVGGAMVQSVFAFGCAAGSHSACTNRGGGMRNGGYDRDPSQQWDKGKRDACLFRLFNKACPEDNGWGCAMLGQAYQYGEGVEKDIKKARSLFANVCDGPDDDEPSCIYARSQLSDTE